jgi:hypothetical protein
VSSIHQDIENMHRICCCRVGSRPEESPRKFESGGSDCESIDLPEVGR